MRTDFDTLKSLATHIVNHLTQKKIIEYGVEHRSQIIDALATELAVGLSTDEDIKEQAIEEVEEKFGLEEIPEDITETEMYNHARKEIIKAFHGENIAGMYMIESLHNLSNRVKDFLLNYELIDDVFSTDDEIVETLVPSFRSFKPVAPRI